MADDTVPVPRYMVEAYGKFFTDDVDLDDPKIRNEINHQAIRIATEAFKFMEIARLEKEPKT